MKMSFAEIWLDSMYSAHVMEEAHPENYNEQITDYYPAWEQVVKAKDDEFFKRVLCATDAVNWNNEYILFASKMDENCELLQYTIDKGFKCPRWLLAEVVSTGKLDLVRLVWNKMKFDGYKDDSTFCQNTMQTAVSKNLWHIWKWLYQTLELPYDTTTLNKHFINWLLEVDDGSNCCDNKRMRPLL
jgi:hypothetical protein